MRNLIILSVLLAAAALYTYASDFSHAPQTQEAEESNANNNIRPAPDFTFAALDGTKHNLADFKDKVIVLNFWATWCAPCVVEFPQMLRLAKNTEKETVFLFLSVDEKADDIARFLSRKANKPLSSNVIIARDEHKKISQDLFQTVKFPETYLIAPGLRIADKIVGAEDWSTPDMKDRILSLPGKAP